MGLDGADLMGSLSDSDPEEHYDTFTPQPAPQPARPSVRSTGSRRHSARASTVADSDEDAELVTSVRDLDFDTEPHSVQRGGQPGHNRRGSGSSGGLAALDLGLDDDDDDDDDADSGVGGGNANGNRGTGAHASRHGGLSTDLDLGSVTTASRDHPRTAQVPRPQDIRRAAAHSPNASPLASMLDMGPLGPTPRGDHANAFDFSGSPGTSSARQPHTRAASKLSSTVDSMDDMFDDDFGVDGNPTASPARTPAAAAPSSAASHLVSMDSMFDEDFGDEPGPQEVGYFSQGGGRAAATSLAPVPAPAPPAALRNAAFSETADSMDDMFDDPALATPVSSAATHNPRPPLAPTPTSAGGGGGGGRARPASQRRPHALMLGSDDGSDSMDAMFDEDFGGPPTPAPSRAPAQPTAPPARRSLAEAGQHVDMLFESDSDEGGLV